MCQYQLAKVPHNLNRLGQNYCFFTNIKAYFFTSIIPYCVTNELNQKHHIMKIQIIKT